MKSNLIWLDLEMTGLDSSQHRIIEIAVVVTNSNLEILAEGPNLIIHQSDEHLKTMNSWCVEQHGKSGLTDKVRASNITQAQAQAQVLSFLSKWSEPNTSPLCGNTIGQDRRFLVSYMPELAQFFHYRSIDVSSIKELASRWKPDCIYAKESTHTALSDIKDSINELKHYREQGFIG